MEKSKKASMDKMRFFILYLDYHLPHPTEAERPGPFKVQSQDDHHSNKCSDFSMQFALKIFFF